MSNEKGPVASGAPRIITAAADQGTAERPPCATSAAVCGLVELACPGAEACRTAAIAQPTGRAVEQHKPRRSIPANARPREVVLRAAASRWTPQARRDEAVRVLLARGAELTPGQRADLLALLCSAGNR
ncbi:hypothetical protein GCM10020218_041060 [Dactylosporangium vinaceum]|uniref:hypothetical protein n=1 Tax=Dactylosporangium vinaceum TaxID=53362 RepID=UPI00338A5705